MPGELGDDLNGPVMRFLLRCTVGLYTRDWLDEQDILHDEESLEDQVLMVFGFPKEKAALNPTRHEVAVRSLLYVTGLYNGERGAWDRDDTFHDEYAVDLDFWPGHAVGIQGRRVRQPTPKGISGGGIWILTQGPAKRPPVMLVGIQHRWHKTLHCLRGTRIVGLTEEIEPVPRELRPLP